MKKILLLLICISGMQISYGQNGYGAITYSLALPMGDMKNYIDDISYRGVNMEFYWRLKNSLDVGMEAGWNVFYSKEDKKTYTAETASITGVQYRYINAAPILAAARWRKSGGKTQPYVGVGVGTSSINRSTDFGLYRIINNTWQFCLRPEAGIIYKFSDTNGLTAGVKYYNNFKNDEQDAQTFLTLNLGFVFSLSHR